jgi:hypothetical protein
MIKTMERGWEMGGKTAREVDNEGEREKRGWR